MASEVNKDDAFGVWYHKRFGMPLECGHAKEAKEVWEAAKVSFTEQPDELPLAIKLKIRRAIIETIDHGNLEAGFDDDGNLHVVNKILRYINAHLRESTLGENECDCNPHGFVSTKCKKCNWGPATLENIKPPVESSKIDEVAFSIAENQCLDGSCFGAKADDEYRTMPTRRIREFLTAYETARSPEREAVTQWQPIEALPEKLRDDVFCAYFNSRGDCCWVKLKRTLQRVTPG